MWHLSHILRLKVLLLGHGSFTGHLIHVVLHLILADTSHILPDKVLVVLGPGRVLLDQVATLDVYWLRLELNGANLGWYFREFFHLKRCFGLYIETDE